jgi:hypothetical protein
MGQVSITLVGNELEAQQICARLQLERIPCFFRGLNSIPSRAIGLDGPCEIVVNEEDAERAAELIAAGR